MNSVIFSESFLTEGNFDHQFRITIQDDKLTMDYVKIDENDDLEYTFTKEIESYGTIFKIIATAPKDWLHYSIHIIEPVLNIFNLYNDNT